MQHIVRTPSQTTLLFALNKVNVEYAEYKVLIASLYGYFQ